MSSRRQQAIRRRRIFIGSCIAVLIALIAVIVLIVSLISNALSDKDKPKEDTSSVTSSEITESKPAVPGDKAPQMVTRGKYTLDANYERLLLVNGEYPLPGDFDFEASLTTIDDKYINGSLKQIDKGVWPYMQAMIDAAWADGVRLYVWSPYRSFDTQNMLFQKQVNRCIANGIPEDKAEQEASTVVARPGTSEHNTGLAADFNMADDAFESTPMYEWMTEHAEEYGFIMRYSADKQDKTGVIHESWHWRFVGINTAKEINDLGMCLEEYIEYKGYDPQYELTAENGSDDEPTISMEAE